jgi:hypothetical protein
VTVAAGPYLRLRRAARPLGRGVSPCPARLSPGPVRPDVTPPADAQFASKCLSIWLDVASGSVMGVTRAELFVLSAWTSPAQAVPLSA